MKTKDELIAGIKKHLPRGMDPECVIREDSLLADLGVTSLHLISLVLALEQEHGVDREWMIHSGMPITIGDLVRLLEQGAPICTAS